MNLTLNCNTKESLLEANVQIKESLSSQEIDSILKSLKFKNNENNLDMTPKENENKVLQSKNEVKWGEKIEVVIGDIDDNLNCTFEDGNDTYTVNDFQGKVM